MPKVSAAHLEARRDQILHAACACFGRAGIVETSIQDICREAQLSVGAVYRYFPSKGAIVEAIAQLGRDNTRRHFASIGAGGDPIERLASLISGALRFLETDAGRESIRFNMRFWSEGLHAEPIRKLLVEGFSDACVPFVESVRAGQQQGIIDQGVEARHVASVLIALHMGLSVVRGLDPSLDLAGCMSVVETLVGGSFVTREPHSGSPAHPRAEPTDRAASETPSDSWRAGDCRSGDGKRRTEL